MKQRISIISTCMTFFKIVESNRITPCREIAINSRAKVLIFAQYFVQ